MAITGSGIEADPYVVQTYAELVSKATEQGVFINFGNDINITNEYPDGDMPTLTINSGTIINGDGKKLYNPYKITSGYVISNGHYSSNANGKIANLSIKNVYIDGDCTAFAYNLWAGHILFENCDIGGIFYKPFLKNGAASIIKKCSINLNNKSSSIFDDNGVTIEKSYIKGNFNGTSVFNNTEIVGSYIEVNAPNLSGDFISGETSIINNCVLDITSTGIYNVTSSSGSVSIFKSSSSPNATPDGTYVKGVSDANWLDVNYLSSIGFNAG